MRDVVSGKLIPVKESDWLRMRKPVLACNSFVSDEKLSDGREMKPVIPRSTPAIMIKKRRYAIVFMELLIGL